MPRYLIEREIPGAGRMGPEDLRGAAQKSCKVLRMLGPEIEWEHSYVTGDKIYCIYSAPSEELIKKHAAESGFPANKIVPVEAVIDPSTAG
ncbi:MAG TPA: DUF4242 domain-containing protein [Acidobacteriota bacterium]|nr:DUF4242 domain-containing protein [Acidobacteriota bacterium]